MATRLLFFMNFVLLLWTSSLQAEVRLSSLRSDPGESPAASYPSVFQQGLASWYETGKQTANGEAFRPDSLTAAHRSLPFGMRLKVVHPRSGRSIVVRINDRGPFIRGRVLDLSRGAARALGVRGVAVVTLLGIE